MKAFLKAKLKSEVIANLTQMGITHPEQFENFFSTCLENIHISHLHEVNQELVSTVTQEIIDKLAKSAALSGFPNVEAKTTTPMFSGVEKERKFDAHISECVKKIIAEIHEYVVIHQERYLEYFYTKYIPMIKEIVSLHAPNSQIMDKCNKHEFFADWYGKAKEYIQCLMVIGENEQKIKIEELRRRRIKIDKELDGVKPLRKSKLTKIGEKGISKSGRITKKERHKKRISYLQTQIDNMIQANKKERESVVSDNYSYNDIEDAVFADLSEEVLDSDDGDFQNDNQDTDQEVTRNYNTNMETTTNHDTNIVIDLSSNQESDPDVKFDSKKDEEVESTIQQVKEFDLTDLNFGFKTSS